MGLLKWAKDHCWDSLEPEKDLIIRHLRTYVGDEELLEKPQAHQSGGAVVRQGQDGESGEVWRRRLLKSLGVIKIWHNMGHSEEEGNFAWNIYYENAPEMAVFRQVFGHKPPDA